MNSRLLCCYAIIKLTKYPLGSVLPDNVIYCVQLVALVRTISMLSNVNRSKLHCKMEVLTKFLIILPSNSRLLIRQAGRGLQCQ